MTKIKYNAAERKIVEQMEAIGTYNESFAPVIRTLAKIQAELKKAEKAFKDSGGEYTILSTNKSGAEYRTKNPDYGIVEGMRTQILAYYNTLGLTPAGLKKINDRKMKTDEKKGDVLGDAFAYTSDKFKGL